VSADNEGGDGTEAAEEDEEEEAADEDKVDEEDEDDEDAAEEEEEGGLSGCGGDVVVGDEWECAVFCRFLSSAERFFVEGTDAGGDEEVEDPPRAWSQGHASPRGHDEPLDAMKSMQTFWLFVNIFLFKRFASKAFFSFSNTWRYVHEVPRGQNPPKLL